MSDSSKAVAESLKEFFESSSEAILFTGAGVSMLAGLPDWRGLLTQMAESVRAADPLTAQQMAELVAAGKLTKAADYYWLSCRIPCDHVPLRSWPLFKARDVMRGVIESLKAESIQ